MGNLRLTGQGCLQVGGLMNKTEPLLDDDYMGYGPLIIMNEFDREASKTFLLHYDVEFG